LALCDGKSEKIEKFVVELFKTFSRSIRASHHFEANKTTTKVKRVYE
jgi:hypothetical protein